MKLIKTKKVETITEEITVEEGTYYFSLGYLGDEPYEYYKIGIQNNGADDSYPLVEITRVRDSYDDYLILSKSDYMDSLPYTAESYFKGEKIDDEQVFKTITEEEFFAVKEKVKQKL